MFSFYEEQTSVTTTSPRSRQNDKMSNQQMSKDNYQFCLHAAKHRRESEIRSIIKTLIKAFL